MSGYALWLHCALIGVILVHASPIACPENACFTYRDGKCILDDKASREIPASLLQQEVRRGFHRGVSLPQQHLEESSQLDSSLMGSTGSVGSNLGSDSGLRKFWVIALSSYFMSLGFTILVWYYFFMKGKTNELDDGSSSEEEGLPAAAISSTTASGHILTAVAHSAVHEERPLEDWENVNWKIGTQQERLQIAGLTSFILSCTLGVYAVLRFFHRPACAPFRPGVHVPEMAALVGLILLTGACWKFPSNLLYWPALAILLFYIPAVTLPPFNLSCDTLENECIGSDHWRISQAINHVDCSLQGQTAQQIFLTTFLLLPWLLPEAKFLYLMCVWIFSVYIVWSIAYFRYSDDGEKAFDALDVVTRTILLVCTLFAAVLKKYYVQKSQMSKYGSDLARREDSLKLYHILEFMLPEHVIVRMLTDRGGTIADQIDEASIMFIVIDDFESIVRSKSPELLLRFLNQYFSKFDTICKHYGVQKIETVGEEYVCCVGATPSDVDEGKRNGHGVIVRRLFKAASAILQLQTDGVKFKLGMHTGPIVAGVIAQKLPRYRLFGDTINTSARMMQKGQVGFLQFGEATQRYMPADMKSTPRGKIEMKGKGEVEAFLFSPQNRQNTVVTGSANFDDSDDEAKGENSQEGGGLLKVLLQPQPVLTPNSNVPKVREPKHPRDMLHPTRRPDRQKSQRQFRDVVTEIQAETRRKAAGVLSVAIDAHRQNWILSEKQGMEDIEEKFRQHFHKDHTCKKLGQRLDIQMLMIIVLTVLEFLWNIPSPHHPDLGWAQQHDIFGVWARQPIYLGSRATAVAIIICIRSAVKSSWTPHYLGFQNILVLGSCGIVLAMFLSYDVMITGIPSASTDERLARVLAPFDQIFSLVFVLQFFFFCSSHKVLFFQSLIFIPVSLLIILCTSVRSHSGVYFPVIGQVLFVVIAISFSVLAHSEEQSLRARFKANRATEETSERVEAILKTMMPPMVLEQVQGNLDGSSTGVHHAYELATIAQSDLCGFTKIASNLEPNEVVKFISELFGMFDNLTDQFEVYKVETVGDAYIGGQAEHPLTAKNSPSSVIHFGIAMIQEVNKWSKQRGLDVKCRVGVHHGSCIGGIVDKEMQRYHIFGELMQVMEILESTAPEGSVQISPACREAVLKERIETGQVEKPELHFQEREGDHLTTSKGETHNFDETGGRTFVIAGAALGLNLQRQYSLGRASDGTASNALSSGSAA
jgi:class 3 adenylate cyclase